MRQLQSAHADMGGMMFWDSRADVGGTWTKPTYQYVLLAFVFCVCARARVCVVSESPCCKCVCLLFVYCCFAFSLRCVFSELFVVTTAGISGANWTRLKARGRCRYK